MSVLALICILLSSVMVGTVAAHPRPDHEEHPPAEHEEHPPADPQGPPVPQREALTELPSTCESGECTGVVPAVVPGLAGKVSKRTRGSNSQLGIPQNLLLADVDADGASDFLQYSSNKIFVSKTDFEKTGLLHLYLDRPIKRIVSGDFHGDGNDQICAATDSGALQCFGISTNRRELWWWFTQPVFFRDNEDTIVGDFDGDGRDDILVYSRTGGAYRLYSIKGNFFFGPTPSFSQGNLVGSVGSGKKVRAGDFNGDGRSDLMIVNSSGQILYYVSVHDGANHTFWWAFTTRGGLVRADDQVTVARIDDNLSDDVVLHNQVTGVTRFYHMEWADGALPMILTIPTGQIHNAGNTLLFWGYMHGGLSEPGADYRDDAMVYDLGTNMFVRSDARWDGSGLTYWWAYTQHAPNNHTGWAPLSVKRWLLLKCKLSDIAAEPRDDQFYREMLLGGSGLTGYWRDISYGSWDLSGGTVVDGWNQMTVSQTDWVNNLSRYDRAGACMNAYSGSKSGYVNTISIVNGEGDAGNAGGRVLATPDSSNLAFLSHEVGHTFGWGHSFDDTTRKNADWSTPGEYFDHWDIMSAMAVHSFAHPQAVVAGPEMNAPYRTKQSFIPAHRILRLTLDDVRRGVRTPIAALNRPEANGPLAVRVGKNDKDYYSLEYRMQSGWDQGIPRATVLVHRVTNGTSYLITAGGTERLSGSVSSFVLEGQRFYVRVHGFAGEGYTADVTLETRSWPLGGIFDVGIGGGKFAHSLGLKLQVDHGVFTKPVKLQYIPQQPTNIGDRPHVGIFYQLTAHDPETQAEVALVPEKTYEIRVSLANAKLGGLNRQNLALYYWHDGHWVREPSSKLDLNLNEVVATPNHFSLWAVLEDTSVSRAHTLYLPQVHR
jgi:hypothetical protein